MVYILDYFFWRSSATVKNKNRRKSANLTITKETRLRKTLETACSVH